MTNTFSMPRSIKNSYMIPLEYMRKHNSILELIERGHVILALDDYKECKESLYDKLTEPEQIYAKLEIIAALEEEVSLDGVIGGSAEEPLNERCDFVIATIYESVNLVKKAELGHLPCGD